MLVDLQIRRRAVALAYQRYIEADYAWKSFTQRAMSWLPDARQGHIAIVGNPGSKVRRLYRQRERAMLQLETARLALNLAKARLLKRHRQASMGPLLIGVSLSSNH